MSYKRAGIVLIILCVVGTALIVQKKFHMKRSSNSTVSQSDSSALNTFANKNPLQSIEHNIDDENVKVHSSNSEIIQDAQLENLMDIAVRKATSNMQDELRKQDSMNYQKRWYQKTYQTTTERLKDTAPPQTVHGTIGFRELYESLNEPAVIVAKQRDRDVSYSMIVDGAYSLGQLDPGTYDIYLNETSKTPGIWVHSVEIKKNQPSLPVNFKLGEASVKVRVYDNHGSLLESDDADLLIGGTAKDVHTWKKAKELKHGLWEINHLYADQYFVKAVWNGKTVGGLSNLGDGENEIALSFEKGDGKVASISPDGQIRWPSQSGQDITHHNHSHDP